MLWAQGHTIEPPLQMVDGVYEPPLNGWQGVLHFTEGDLQERYDELAPKFQVDLVVIGCPQASLEEMRMTAAAVRTHMEFGRKIPNHRLWVFTSSQNYHLAADDGTLELLEEAGALVLKDTCPEVTPYNRQLYRHLLTNSMKAEHYLTSGLNQLHTSVLPISECVRHAFDPTLVSGAVVKSNPAPSVHHSTSKTHQTHEVTLQGSGLDSQNDFHVEGLALVTDVPITYLGYVNPDTGVIEEPGHPLDGECIQDRIFIYPKGSGSTVAPYVLMGLHYQGKGPQAVINRDVCSLTLPACSMLNIPYGHGMDNDPCLEINSGDRVECKRTGDTVTLRVIQRTKGREA